MDAIEFVSQCLRQVQLRTIATCDGLTEDQAIWRPTSTANSIGFILWHLGRGEDFGLARMRGDANTLWVDDGWHERFDQPVESPDPGDRMGLHALRIPALDVLLDYFQAVAARTMEFVSGLTPDQLDVVPHPSESERTLAMSLRHLITHKNNHHGQIDYIRGLQDENWDLPRGTGVILPSS